MNYDHEKFLDAYNKASQEKKDLIDSELIVKCVTDICDRYAVPPELKRDFTLMYAYMVIDMISEQEMMDFLNNTIKPEVGADKLFSSLLVCIAKENQPPEQTEEPASEANDGEIDQKPGWSTEVDTTNIPVIRTMQQDKDNQ